ncbi:MAG: PD40 domain-containing protein [Deltaproteobacteria bacterium]|nr:PD40 domain-containing protein [Deltaproteobacteria bacterium]
MRKNLLCLFFIILPTLLYGATFDPSLRWSTLKTDHFAIHFHEGEEALSQRAASLLEEAYQQLGAIFGVYPWGKTQVVIVDNHDQANGFATVLPYNSILLRVVPPSPETALGYYDDWLKELVFHEYTHILHLNDVGAPMKGLKFLFGKMIAPNGLTPTWVAEGIASFFETEMTGAGRGRASFSEMLLRTDTLHGKFLNLDQMAGTQYDWPGYLAGYLYGVKFWQFLSDKQGKDKLIKFSHKYGASPLFFGLSNKAWRAYGKTFRTLWREWKAELEKKYADQKKILEAEGLREGEPVVTGKDSYLHPSPSPDGQSLIYLEESVHRAPSIQSLVLATGEKKRVVLKKSASGFRFEPSGRRVVFSSQGLVKRYSYFEDLHTIDLETGKSEQLTQGKRGRDPDFSPDGKRLVFVVQETGRSSLAFYDLASKETAIIYEGQMAEQLDTPRFSPDGKRVALSIWKGGSPKRGKRDIAIFDTDKKIFSPVTDDPAMETGPVWDPDGSSLYFSSDRSGIANIYRHTFKTKKTEKITNVLTGAFSPTVSADAKSLYFQYYHGRGYEIRKIALGESRDGLIGSSRRPDSRKPSKDNRAESADNGFAAFERNRLSVPDNPSLLSPPKPYSPWGPSLLPHYIMPNALYLDGSLFVSAMIGSHDPLERHFWFGGPTYRTDARFIGFNADYFYNRWTPSFFTGASRYAVNYGDIFRIGSDYFEQRWRGHSGIRIPLDGAGSHRTSVSYFFEGRDNLSTIPTGTAVPTEGRYAGLHFQYNWDTRGQKFYPASISPEGGHRLNMNFMLTDEVLGSKAGLEQQLFWGEERLFLPLPWQHHVIALRSAGGIALGDQLFQGNFGLGGAIGEGFLTGTSSRVFSLRGLPLVTFSRDRAMVISAEYRVPLFRLQRGLGTLPLFLNSAHLGLFADYGDAWNKDQKTGGFVDFFKDFLLGVGAELRGDFVIGYHIPVTGRLGYGIIVVNQARVAGLTDPILGSNIKNGVLILELGTSF